MLATGEDPWPTPPPPQFGDETEYLDAAIKYVFAP
jgi:hypothetical protein